MNQFRIDGRVEFYETKELLNEIMYPENWEQQNHDLVSNFTPGLNETYDQAIDQQRSSQLSAKASRINLQIEGTNIIPPPTPNRPAIIPESKPLIEIGITKLNKELKSINF